MYDKWAMDTAIGKGYLSGTVYVGGHAIHQEIVQDFNNVSLGENHVFVCSFLLFKHLLQNFQFMSKLSYFLFF